MYTNTEVHKFFCSKARFPANVFHEITGITDALKKIAHDQDEQTVHQRMYLQQFLRLLKTAMSYQTHNQTTN